MGDIDGSARSENGKSAGITEACSVCRAVLDLRAETESVSTRVCLTVRLVIYLGTVEQGARASGVGDAEGVLGEGAQDPTGIVQEFEGLVTGVGNGRGDLQVLQPVDVSVGD